MRVLYGDGHEEMKREETIEMSVALHLLIHLPTPYEKLPLKSHHDNHSLRLPYHSTTSIPRTILPASVNSQLSANECGIDEDSVSSISSLAFVLTSAKLKPSILQ